MRRRVLPLKVIFFSRSPYGQSGGLENVFSALLAGSDPRFIDVIPVYTAEEERERNLDSHSSVSLTLPRTRYRIPTLTSSIGVVRSLVSLARLLQKVRPDVVNCHYVDYTTAYFAFLKPFFGYRLVVTAHGSDLMQPSSLDAALLPYILRAADHLIGVSDALSERARTLVSGAVHTTTIRNGIDYAFWSDGTRASSDRPIIVTVGSLRRVKGHDVLLRAFQHIVREVEGAELRLIGDGPEREQLEQLASDLGIASRVSFVGWRSREEVRDELYRASVFAFPSRSEGLGLALIEALAVGIPCVASDVGGIPEVISSPDVGCLVPPEDPDALAEELIGVMSDAARADQLSKAGRERAQAFSWEEALDAYTGVLLPEKSETVKLDTRSANGKQPEH